MKPIAYSAALVPVALLLGACGIASDAVRSAGQDLSGRGYVHYHPYPDTGQCYCGSAYDFAAHGKRIAAASESIHRYFGDSLCERPRYAYVTSLRTGAAVRVLIVDKGGLPTNDFGRLEQHIMDLSVEAFRELDTDGEGYRTGRIYVDWEIRPE
jgi:hypothetical protein